MKAFAVVDTHAHLCDPSFDPDLDKVLERARAAGVTGVIAVGEDLSDAEKNLELAASHEYIYPAAGLYPSHLGPDQAEEAESRRERKKEMYAHRLLCRIF